MSKLSNWNLKYFETGEWQVVQERLDDLKVAGILYNPSHKLIFRALEVTPFESVRVVLMGQDPYPNHNLATGLAFSIPSGVVEFPASLKNIFKEYQDDLHYPEPTSGDLSDWAKRGVLLWNAFPTCLVGKAGSHHWIEWEFLTKEIVEKLDVRGDCVFALLGSYARGYTKYINNSPIVETSHPSPLGANKGFLGSRLFSTINSNLKEPIDWRLS